MNNSSEVGQITFSMPLSPMMFSARLRAVKHVRSMHAEMTAFAPASRIPLETKFMREMCRLRYRNEMRQGQHQGKVEAQRV